MKAILTCFCLLVFTASTAQRTLGEFPYRKKSFIIGSYFTTAFVDPYGPRVALGLEMEYMVGRRFGFGAIGGGGPDYLELSTSILGVLAIQDLGNPSTHALALLSALLAFSNPVVHFQQAKNSEFSLSVDLLQIRYVYERSKNDDNTLFIGCSLMLRHSFYRSAKAQWSFFMGPVIFYSKDDPAIVQLGKAYRFVTDSGL